MRGFSSGLGAGRYARVILKAYVMGGSSYLIFWFAGIGPWADSLLAGDGFWPTVVTAGVKFGFIVVVVGQVHQS